MRATPRPAGRSGGDRTMSLHTAPKLWEYTEIALPRGVSRETARLYLTEVAETGRWELARVHMLPDGRRRITLRRRVYRVARTA